MKKLFFAVSTLTILSACSSKPQRDDAKIKACINTYLTTGIDKKDVPKIDSISINSADTLTEKNCLKIAMNHKYELLKSLNAIYVSKLELLKADSALLGSLQQQVDLYKKHGEHFDESSLKNQTEKIKTDSAEIIESRVSTDKTKNSIDSLSKLYSIADSVSFYAYFVGAAVHIHGSDQETGNYIVTKDWKVSR